MSGKCQGGLHGAGDWSPWFPVNNDDDVVNYNEQRFFTRRNRMT